MNNACPCMNHVCNRMNLECISKVIQVTNEKDANSYLDTGWKLLLVCNPVEIHANATYPCYVLGWAGENPAYPSNHMDYGDPSEYI